MADINTYKGCYEAKEVAENILIAYYLDETYENPGYHLKVAHENFKKLAENLGYSLVGGKL